MPSIIKIIGAASLCLASFAASTSEFDLVVHNGRVIDPESGLDATRNIGIRAGRIAAISTDTLTGVQSIDASNLVVAPGFIDIHSHTPTPFGQDLNALDGVTTQLDTEAGAYPNYLYGDAIQNRPRLNFGASVGYYAIRMKVIEGRDQPYFFYKDKLATMKGPAWQQVATAEQIEEMRSHLAEGLAQGGLGIGLLLDYMTDAVSEAELEMIFEVASQHHVPVFTHVRRGMPGDPAGLEEILALAEQYKTGVFICHITHNAMQGVGDWLKRIDATRAKGIPVATETLSYLAGGTSISADVFRKRDWQAIFNISYEDVQWVETGEWLTKERWDYFAKNRPSGAVNHHYVKEEWLVTALQWPDMMISTDALPAFSRAQFSNPNISGTFSLVLGDYVRDKQVLTLSDALAKMSLKQAQWLEPFAPDFRYKGRIQAGMDADIVVFNANTVDAVADYGTPYEPSAGIEWVIVNGEVAVANGALTAVGAGRRLTTQ